MAPPSLPSIVHFARATACAGLVLLAPSACVATAEGMASRGVVVSGPPPAPLVEVRPAPPPNRSAWIGGYWHWTGMHYAWIPGHWDSPPGGAEWVGPRYFQQGGQFLYEAGTWVRDSGAKALR